MNAVLDIRDLVKNKEALKKEASPNILKAMNRSVIMRDGMYGEPLSFNSQGFVVPTVDVKKIDINDYEVGELFRDGETGCVFICTDKNVMQDIPEFETVPYPSESNVYLQYVEGVGFTWTKAVELKEGMSTPPDKQGVMRIHDGKVFISKKE
ncbi:MAG: hypothetical protein M0R38_10855 [Bacteroidia bacterium]|nr:hypothetical protein [Bacteroidia bacterium]